ncbi:MAG TPA: ATP-binding protein [Candidatus Saccharimonadales bacterium]|nr:ATP-binding protein [Candidatus Saccharimonadales bacterium]
MEEVPHLKLLFSGGRHRVVPVRADPFTIGRRHDCHLVIPNEDISRLQAVIRRRGDEFVLEDHQSLFGTTVNGQQIQSCVLRNRDVVSFGREKNLELLFLHGDRMSRILDEVDRTPDRKSTHEELRNLRILLEISKGLNAFTSLTNLLALSLDAVIDLTRAERGFVMLRNGEGELETHAARNMAGERLHAENLRISSTVVSEVLRTRRPVFHEDALGETGLRDRSSIAELKLRAIACLPIRMPAARTAGEPESSSRGDTGDAGGSERILGVIYTDSSEATKPVSELTRELVESVASHAAIAIENFRLRQEELERRILESEMEKLREVDRLKSDFVSHVSHELRTPLTALQGALDNMLDGLTGNLNEKQTRYLERMKGNTSDLVRLIEDLLDLSRIEAGQIALHPRPMPVAKVLSEACDSLGPLAAARKIDLSSEAPGDLEVRADRDRIMQILLNLAGNALKFTREGGRVGLTAELLGDRALIRVADTGIGIEPAAQDRIFERFYRIEPPGSGRVEGTGLGLAIAKSLVELHGGGITVESQVGSGTTFTVSLPVDGPPRTSPRTDPAAAARSLPAGPDRSLEG